jgi:hypothetical protein
MKNRAYEAFPKMFPTNWLFGVIRSGLLIFGAQEIPRTRRRANVSECRA